MRCHTKYDGHAIDAAARHPHVPLVRKTLQHGGCGNASEPMAELPTPDHPMYRDQRHRWQWQWHTFAARDRRTKAFFARRPNTAVLDLTPLAYRAEAHPGKRPPSG